MSFDGRLDINVSIGGGAARVPSDYDYHHYTELDERAMDENTVKQRQTLPDTYDRLCQHEAPHEYAWPIPNKPNVSQDGHYMNTKTTGSAAHDYLAPQEYASVIPNRPNVSQDGHYMNTEKTESAGHDYLELIADPHYDNDI